MRSSRGLTLVETLIGLGLVAVIAVTLATLVAVGRQATAGSRRELMALALARSKLEQLEGLAFSRYALASGGTVEVTDLVTDVSGDLPRLGGAGLADGPADALVEPRPGYADYLDAQGRWVGTDEGALRRAAYVRRWAVRRTGAGGSEWVAFEVLVAPSSVARRATAAQLLSSPHVVRLLGARTRRAL